MYVRNNSATLHRVASNVVVYRTQLTELLPSLTPAMDSFADDTDTFGALSARILDHERQLTIAREARDSGHDAAIFGYRKFWTDVQNLGNPLSEVDLSPGQVAALRRRLFPSGASTSLSPGFDTVAALQTVVSGVKAADHELPWTPRQLARLEAIATEYDSCLREVARLELALTQAREERSALADRIWSRWQDLRAACTALSRLLGRALPVDEIFRLPGKRRKSAGTGELPDVSASEPVVSVQPGLEPHAPATAEPEPSAAGTPGDVAPTEPSRDLQAA